MSRNGDSEMTDAEYYEMLRNRDKNIDNYGYGGMGRYVQDALMLQIYDLKQAIRKHRDASGHNRCWENDAELWAALGEPYPEKPDLPCKEKFLKECNAYYASKTGESYSPPLSFEGYSKEAMSTALNVNKDDIVYPTLGLGGESGEVQEKVKKILRDKGGVVTDEDKHQIALELGDILWYINRLSWGLGYSLRQIAEMNIEKLRSRKTRNVLSGSGDNR